MTPRGNPKRPDRAGARVMAAMGGVTILLLLMVAGPHLKRCACGPATTQGGHVASK